MTAPKPEATTVGLALVGDALPEIIERAAVAGERIVVEKNGVRLAVIVPVQSGSGHEREARMEALFAEMSRLGEAFADVPLDELERQVEREARAVRAERSTASRKSQGG